MSKSGWANSQKISVQLHDDHVYHYLRKMIELFFESIRGIYYHRAINEYIKEQNDDWYKGHIIYLSGISLDIGVITWAKLFGSEWSQDIHFLHFLEYTDLKDYLSKLNVSTKDELEKKLLIDIGIDKVDFDNYKNESIIKYRDEFVAHTDLKWYLRIDDDPATIENKKKNQLSSFPVFDIAIKTLNWLYSFIIGLLECKKSRYGNYCFAICDRDLIEKQITEECSALIAALKHGG